MIEIHSSDRRDAVRQSRQRPRRTDAAARCCKTAAAAGLLAVPSLFPARRWARTERSPPSERILLGGIGLGGRGRSDLNWMLVEPDVQFLAICDPNKSRREIVKKMVDEKYGNKDCATYPDIREFLALRTDLDAVLIATGDRWHALASIMAMRAGKDVYCEKPSCMTIAEGQMVVATARQYGRVYQSGTQGLSMPNRVFGIELARSGRLGKLHTAYAQLAPWGEAMMRHDWLPAEPEPPKEEMNWDAWLGPCPWRPYNSEYVRGGWRHHYDFHTSCIGEWGAHTIVQVQAGIDALDTSAVEYEYVDNPTGDGLVARFANGVKMILSLQAGVLGRLLGPAVRRHAKAGSPTPATATTTRAASSPRPAGRLPQRAGRLHGPHAASPEPRARLPRLHQVAPPDRGQPRGHAPLHDHRARRQHLHVAEAEPEIRPGQGGVHQRPRGQPAPLAGDARAVERVARQRNQRTPTFALPRGEPRCRKYMRF